MTAPRPPLDAARAALAAGDPEEASRCFARAIATATAAPPTEWRVLLTLVPELDLDLAALAEGLESRDSSLVVMSGAVPLDAPLDGVTVETWHTRRHRDIRLWPVARHDLCARLERTPAEIERDPAPYLGEIAREYGRACVMIDRAADFFDAYIPTKVVYEQGHRLPGAVTRALARQRHVALLALETTPDGRLRWDAVGGTTSAGGVADSLWRRYGDGVDPRAAAVFAAQYLTDGATAGVTPPSPVDEDTAPSLSRRRRIAFLRQTADDAALLTGLRRGWDRQDDVLRTVSAHAEARGDAVVTAVAADGTAPSQLVDADVCVTVSAASGLTAVLMGKEIVLCGRAFYGGQGFTHEVDDDEMLRGAIDRVLDDDVRRNRDGLGQRFAYVYLRETCRPRTTRTVLELLDASVPPPPVEGDTGVTVIVTTIDDSPALRGCLARVRAQADALGAEVLLVVNRPAGHLTPAATRALEALSDRLLLVARPGKAGALNAAVRTARNEILAFTDDDAMPDDGWLDAVTAPLRAPDSPYVGAGGQIQPVFETPPPSWLREILARRDTHFLGPLHFRGNTPHDYVNAPWESSPLGANCAYRRSVLIEVPYPPHLGPNLETGGRGGEDYAVAHRILGRGQRLRYTPEARVYHTVHPDRLTLEFTRERYRLSGEEWVALRTASGQSLPSQATLRQRVAALTPGPLRLLLDGRDRSVRHAFERAEAEGALAALAERGADRADAWPEHPVKKLSAVVVAGKGPDEALARTLDDLVAFADEVVLVGPAAIGDTLVSCERDTVRFFARDDDLPREAWIDFGLDQAFGRMVLLVEPGERITCRRSALRFARALRPIHVFSVMVGRDGRPRRERRLFRPDAARRHATGGLPPKGLALPTRAVRID